MRNRKVKRNKILKISKAQIELLELEYYKRLNSEIPQWQQQKYS
tara:strand:+ start:372 stop:503 length:132 start_codon:yes stop_codon:yes gene_type:complete